MIHIIDLPSGFSKGSIGFYTCAWVRVWLYGFFGTLSETASPSASSYAADFRINVPNFKKCLRPVVYYDLLHTECRLIYERQCILIRKCSGGGGVTCWPRLFRCESRRCPAMNRPGATSTCYGLWTLTMHPSRDIRMHCLPYNNGINLLSWRPRHRQTPTEDSKRCSRALAEFKAL